jgi:ParB family transcriptional regulator, chromosome partitioning protein
MKKQNTAVLNAFASAAESQKVDELYQTIDQLQAELNKLQRAGNSPATLSSDAKNRYEAQIAHLTSQLAAQQGTIFVPIASIKRNPNQPRTVFPAAIMQERAESLKREGQLTPIILLPLTDGDYMLEDGELRWRAAPAAGLTVLEAIVKPIEEIDYNILRRRALVNANQREALHPLDQADALIEEICNVFPDFAACNESAAIAIPRTLNTTIKRLFQDKNLRDQLAQMRLASESEQQIWLESLAFKQIEERQIFQTLLGLQLNPTSVNSNIFPILKVTDDVREGIRVYGLEGSKALQLNRLSAETLKVSERKALTIRAKAIGESVALSVRQTQTLVGQLIRQHAASQKSTQPLAQTSHSTLAAGNAFPLENHTPLQHIQNLEISRSSDRSYLEETRKILQAKLQEIEAILAS